MFPYIDSNTNKEDPQVLFRVLDVNHKKLSKRIIKTPTNSVSSPLLCLHSSGDENLILCHINDQVGYGVFADKDYKR